jgi:hypothetical protein
MDSLELTAECFSEQFEQNSNCNGYHSDTMVNKIYMYGMDGKVFLCALTLLVADMMDLIEQIFRHAFLRTLVSTKFL